MTSGIAKLWKPVVNVCDLDEGERFWSALTGLPPTGRHGDDGMVATGRVSKCVSNGGRQGAEQKAEPTSA